ncbi:MAG: Uma2 family endonuclease [Spirulinaceae cyanobacterium RM2_2_10]|nr:Uma2 family endonuclease [Spirulinaceae cyanobacterium SM2_1_0]NJO21074.1 Uma2 family endonuclease [Spirulinaceae cyanobacterium RM2_2_10]
MSPPHYLPPTLKSSPPLPPRETLPTMYDLPSEYVDEPGVPDEFHIWQPELLSSTFYPPDWERDAVFVASDMHLYYDWQNPLRYKRPDWFGVVGVRRLYGDRDLRLSYVTWQEPALPTVVVELLSPSTRNEDLGRRPPGGNIPRKWEVYEQILAIPYYVTFDRYTDALQIFHLTAGRYTALDLTEPRVWMPELNLGLGLWQGRHRELSRLWLRWYDADGRWVPTEAEQARSQAEQAFIRAEQERGRAEQARLQAEQAQSQAEQAQLQAAQERQRAERLAARLRALGVDPDDL